MTTKLLKVSDVCEILDCKPARVYFLTRNKQLPHIIIGTRQYRWSRAAIEKFIENGGNGRDAMEEVSYE